MQAILLQSISKSNLILEKSDIANYSRVRNKRTPKQIGKKIQEATGEKLSTFYLKQRISIAIQKGNAVCVRGCHKKEKGSPGLEGLFNFHVQEAVML